MGNELSTWLSELWCPRFDVFEGSLLAHEADTRLGLSLAATLQPYCRVSCFASALLSTLDAAALAPAPAPPGSVLAPEPTATLNRPQPGLRLCDRTPSRQTAQPLQAVLNAAQLMQSDVPRQRPVASETTSTADASNSVGVPLATAPPPVRTAVMETHTVLQRLHKTGSLVSMNGRGLCARLGANETAIPPRWVDTVTDLVVESWACCASRSPPLGVIHAVAVHESDVIAAMASVVSEAAGKLDASLPITKIYLVVHLRDSERTEPEDIALESKALALLQSAYPPECCRLLSLTLPADVRAQSAANWFGVSGCLARSWTERARQASPLELPETDSASTPHIHRMPVQSENALTNLGASLAFELAPAALDIRTRFMEKLLRTTKQNMSFRSHVKSYFASSTTRTDLTNNTNLSPYGVFVAAAELACWKRDFARALELFKQASSCHCAAGTGGGAPALLVPSRTAGPRSDPVVRIDLLGAASCLLIMERCHVEAKTGASETQTAPPPTQISEKVREAFSLLNQATQDLATSPKASHPTASRLVDAVVVLTATRLELFMALGTLDELGTRAASLAAAPTAEATPLVVRLLDMCLKYLEAVVRHLSQLVETLCPSTPLGTASREDALLAAHALTLVGLSLSLIGAVLAAFNAAPVRAAKHLPAFARSCFLRRSAELPAAGCQPLMSVKDCFAETPHNNQAAKQRLFHLFRARCLLQKARLPVWARQLSELLEFDALSLGCRLNWMRSAPSSRSGAGQYLAGLLCAAEKPPSCDAPSVAARLGLALRLRRLALDSKPPLAARLAVSARKATLSALETLTSVHADQSGPGESMGSVSSLHVALPLVVPWSFLRRGLRRHIRPVNRDELRKLLLLGRSAAPSELAAAFWTGTGDDQDSTDLSTEALPSVEGMLAKHVGNVSGLQSAHRPPSLLRLALYNPLEFRITIESAQVVVRGETAVAQAVLVAGSTVLEADAVQVLDLAVCDELDSTLR